MAEFAFTDGIIAIKNIRSADPQTIGEELKKIADRNGGNLTPTATVEAAKSPRNCLHKFFEWDDSVAGAAYRLQQARALIRIVRVLDDDDSKPRAFLSIRNGDGTAYRTLADVRGSYDFQTAVLRDAKRDIDAFLRRYAALKEICVEVARARDAIDAKLAAAAPRHEARAAL